MNAEAPMSTNTDIARPEETKTQAKASSTKVNITLKLDKDLVRKVRVLAAEKGTSVSALLAGKLEEELSRRAEYEEAKKHALAVMAEGWDLGGRAPTRAEIYER
jgi:predicted transcriptional regulator